MSKIVPIKRHVAFERQTKRSAAQTLNASKKFGLSEVLVIGIDEDGDLMVRAFPNDPGNALWLMELAKKNLLSGGQ